MNSPKIERSFSLSLSFLLAATIFVGSLPAEAKIGGKIVLGFSQIGAESAWRIANTKSLKTAAAEAGIVLSLSDAQQNQKNQLKAMQTFILQKVDVIAFAPVVVTGWHDVLVAAKKANIPVIVVDREIDEKDTSLYASFIGSDFRQEGLRAGKCLVDYLKEKNIAGPVNIVELRGTEGSAPAIQRKLGFADYIQKFPKLKIIRSENGDFKENIGKELMEKILKEEKAKGVKIDALFAHNDNMALGAIPAIESAGLKPGKDIAIVSVDAIRDAFVAMKEGKINCTVECSPLLGPQLMAAVQDLMNGKTLPRRIITEEGVFPAATAEKALPARKY